MQFIEKQQFKIWWLYLITGIGIFPGLAILLLAEGGMSFNELKNIYFLRVIALFSPLLIVYLFQQSKLTLIINPDGIYYRYFPFQIRFKSDLWKNIEQVYIRKYDAFGDYGGYGVKFKRSSNVKDKAYLLNDELEGLQIEFKNGERLLFSTNKKAEIETFLINFKNTYHIQAIQ